VALSRGYEAVAVSSGDLRDTFKVVFLVLYLLSSTDLQGPLFGKFSKNVIMHIYTLDQSYLQ
jgi:hypothetical protein